MDHRARCHQRRLLDTLLSTPAAPLQVLHRDEHLLALNKPAGVSLLSDRSGEPCYWDQIVAECARQHWGAPKTVHRLDKGTSGVLLVALSKEAQASLNRQFNEGSVEKYYVCEVVGTPAPARAFIDLPLMKGRKSRYRIAGPREAITLGIGGGHSVFNMRGAAHPDGLASQTCYRVLASQDGRATLLVKPLTGRTHQIRVHLTWCGWPLVGDTLYGSPGSEEQAAPRLHLHCTKMSFLENWRSPACRRVVRSRLAGGFGAAPAR